jgi:hypothetical protein
MMSLNLDLIHRPIQAFCGRKARKKRVVGKTVLLNSAMAWCLQLSFPKTDITTVIPRFEL